VLFAADNRNAVRSAADQRTLFAHQTNRYARQSGLLNISNGADAGLLKQGQRRLVRWVGLHLRFCPVQHLEEGGRLGAHPAMDVSLGAFNMVVQVVSEEVDQVDSVVPRLLGRVTRKEYEGDVANAITRPCVVLC